MTRQQHRPVNLKHDETDGANGKMWACSLGLVGLGIRFGIGLVLGLAIVLGLAYYTFVTLAACRSLHPRNPSSPSGPV